MPKRYSSSSHSSAPRLLIILGCLLAIFGSGLGLFYGGDPAGILIDIFVIVLAIVLLAIIGAVGSRLNMSGDRLVTVLFAIIFGIIFIIIRNGAYYLVLLGGILLIIAAIIEIVLAL